MRAITGTDIVTFYNSGDDVLLLTADGHLTTIDDALDPTLTSPRPSAYGFFTDASDGSELQVLLERTTITEGDWFPDALDDDGNLDPAVADEMAAIINNDGILPSRAAKAQNADKAWREAVEDANELAAVRAAAIADIVAITGNQSEAARLIGLDQSTVNKIVRRPGATETTPDLPRTMSRPLELRLPELGSQLADWAAEISGATDTDERDLYLGYITGTLTGVSRALRVLAEHATAEGNRVAAEMETAEAADPGLIENPTGDHLAADDLRLAMFDLSHALHDAVDDAHRRSDLARRTAHRGEDVG